MIKEYFGDELLFACYEFLHEMHRNPKNWHEFFDFLKYCKTKGILREMALAAARAEAGDG